MKFSSNENIVILSSVSVVNFFPLLEKIFLNEFKKDSSLLLYRGIITSYFLPLLEIINSEIAL